MKGVIRHALPAVLFCAASVPAFAATPTVSIDVKNVTVKELLHTIEANSKYTFAYADDDISSGKRVTIKASDRSIASIVAEAIPGAKVNINGNKIVITRDNAADTKEADKASARRKISGKVLDEAGEPVIGATVTVKGTKEAVATDFDGNFSLNVASTRPTLVVSYVGYKPEEKQLTSGESSISFTIQPQATMLDDVVVVGYGVQNKRDVTTSITSIKAEDFAKTPTSDFRDAMAAKMPGVQVLSLGGQPDGNVSIRIRGIQSATSGNDPLYVIDGVPSDARAFANIESSDIESLEVLKDASAAAIYGSRGSCGVVIITTKRGKEEKPTISYDGQVGWSNVSKKIDMLDAYEFATMFKEARDGAYLSQTPGASIGDPYDSRPSSYQRVNPIIQAYLDDRTGTLTNTDWQDEIFRTAISTKHALSVSGKTPSVRYYVGGSYLYREGTIIGSDFERFSARANIDGTRGKLKYGISFSPSYSQTNYVSADAQYSDDGVIACALQSAPIFPVYNRDGSYNQDMNGQLRLDPWDTQYNECMNPVLLANEIDDKRNKINLLGNIYVAYEIIKGLEAKFTVGGDFYSYTRDYYRPSYIEEKKMANHGKASSPKARHWDNSYFHWTMTGQLNYNRTFDDHSINAVAVWEAEKQTIRTSQIYAIGTPGDDKIRTTKGKTIDQENTLDNRYSYTFASWLVRAQYSYKGRYMVSASIRGDGSSRFAPATRWGYFPAASLGWRVSDESFLRDATWLNDLKIRASVGQTGNAQIGNSAYLALYKPTNIDLGAGLNSVIYPSQIANNELGWEKNTQWNAGVDFNILNGYVRFTADAYYSKTTNMLFDVPVSQVSGFDTSNVNIGSMENKGIELQIASDHRFGDFTYSFNANWSLNRNKVLHLGDGDADIIKESSYAGGYYLTRVGQPVGCYYLMIQDGIFHNQQELDSYPHFPTTEVGDFRFVDVNGNGILEKDADRAIVGNYQPDFYYGFGLNLGYKGFDLAANLQGVYGNEILNLERRYLLNMEGSSNMMKESLQRFPYGKLNKATRKSTGNNGSCTSTFHIEDGSYLRLQNLSLGYTLPKAWLSRAGIKNLRVYVQGTNLFTWTKYTGYNPEVNKRSDDALRPGEDYCSYPLSRTVTFGLNFSL